MGRNITEECGKTEIWAERCWNPVSLRSVHTRWQRCPARGNVTRLTLRPSSSQVQQMLLQQLVKDGGAGAGGGSILAYTPLSPAPVVAAPQTTPMLTTSAIPLVLDTDRLSRWARACSLFPVCRWPGVDARYTPLAPEVKVQRKPCPRWAGCVASTLLST